MGSFFRKLIIHLSGLSMMAVGVSLAIQSNLGVSPVSSVPYTLSLMMPFSQGTMTLIVFTLFVGVQWIILKSRFTSFHFLQIVTAGILGYLTDFTNWIIAVGTPDMFILRLLMLLTSVGCFAVGIPVYMSSTLFPIPVEGLQQTIAEELNRPFPQVKLIFDAGMVLTSLLASWWHFGAVVGVSIGTLIAALITGPLISVFRKKCAPLFSAINKFIGVTDPVDG